MSYEKAMKHSRNVRKQRKQANMHFGFNVGSGQQNAFSTVIAEIHCWFKNRHAGDKAYTRECIRERIQDYRKLSEAA